MLRSDGTVAVVPPPVVLLDPQAAIKTATTLEHAASARRRYGTNLIWTSCPLDCGASCCLLPDERGESAPAAGLLRVHARPARCAARRLSIAHVSGFVKK